MEPKFSDYPFDRLRKLSRRDAEVESTIARWIGAGARDGRTVRGDRLGKLAGGPVHAQVVAPCAVFDPFAARCEVRIGDMSIDVRGSSGAVRKLAQRVLGGP